MIVRCVDVGYWIGTLEKGKEYEVVEVIDDGYTAIRYKLKGVPGTYGDRRFVVVEK